MKDDTLQQAKQDIEDALSTIEGIEKGLADKDLSKDLIKNTFNSLLNKVNHLESILKEEGIL